jgi:hypothetical protein
MYREKYLKANYRPANKTKINEFEIQKWRSRSFPQPGLEMLPFFAAV